jgi:hypothetical protein
MDEIDYERFMNAICCLAEMEKMPPRMALRFHISMGWVKRDDGWVDAAMNCAHEKDMLKMALWIFSADVKSGLYDLEPDVNQDEPAEQVKP